MQTMRIFFTGIFLFLVTGINYAATDIKAVNLRCNYSENPVGINDTMPTLSWKLTSSFRGQKQTAYQILAASSKALLSEGLADVWNSGKVVSSQSTQVVYAGKQLLSAKRYYWKVRVWDVNGNSSEYSQASFWEMALLHPSDWKAQWISAPPIFDLDKFNNRRTAMCKSKMDDYAEPLPIFRKEFSVTKEIEKATLYIAAPGFYEFFINGQKVGNQILDPAFTNFDKTVLYAIDDITNFVKKGENVAGVMVGNGWYNSVTREVWGFDKAPWRNLPTIKCQLVLTFTDGATETIVSGPTWLTKPGPLEFSSVRQGEYYNALLEAPAWNETGLNTQNWQQARIVAGPMGKLAPQQLPPVKVTETFKPINSKQLANGNTVYDFGQNMAGFAHIQVSGEAGAQIQLVYAEKVNAEGAADQSGIVELNVDMPFQTDRYTLKGIEIERWSPRFVYHGFRYIEVSFTAKKANLISIEAFAIHTSFDKTATFSCSNELINNIQKLTEWSYRNNFVGMPTDCPTREKNGWTGDAQLACETGMTNFAPITSYLKWLNDIVDEQQSNGSLPGIIPTSGWGYYWGNGPAYDIACIVVPVTLYEHTGDSQILRKYYPMMKKYVDYMYSRSPNLITDFGLGDWMPVKTETPVGLTSTGYFYYGASSLAKAAAILGYNNDEAYYAGMSKNIKEAFNKKYFNAATNQYGNGSQTSLSCALYQGLADSLNKAGIVKNLVDAINQNDNHLNCGILGARYIFHTLSDNDNVGLAYKILTQETYPGFGYWVSLGATTLWEDWKGESSRNHIMFGDISSWFFKTLAGIRPDPVQAGFKHFILKPELVDNLSYVNSSYESVYGTIVSNWKIENKKLTYTIRVPVNTVATLYLPSNNMAGVKEGGIAINKADGILIKGYENAKVVLELGAGKYNFTSQLQ